MKDTLRDQLLIAALAGLFFLPFLGGVHLFEWDEINFAEIAREMVVSGNYITPQIGFENFTEKPPLFFWLQATSMKVFGVSEYSARFPNALAGILVLLTLYRIGIALKNRRFAILWVLAYAGSILPHLYFKSGIIDPWFNFFIFLGLHQFYLHSEKAKAFFSKHLLSASIFLGLAVLTKGPVALLVSGLVVLVLLIRQRFSGKVKLAHAFVYGFGALLVFSLWLLLDLVVNGPEFIVEFTIRQWELLTREDAGHGGFFGYHAVVLLFGCFPMSVLAIRSFFKKREEKEVWEFSYWMKVLFWVVLILFSLVNTKIIHYSSLAYYPLSFLAASAVYTLISDRKKLEPFYLTLLSIIAFLAFAVSFSVPWLGRNIEVLKPLFEKDKFASANLQAAVTWLGWESLAAVFLLVGLVAFLVFQHRKQFSQAYIALFLSTAIFVQFTLIFYINNIEAYSQNALIEFYESKQKEDCYVISVGFKSYGRYFYSKQQIAHPQVANPQAFLLSGKADKTVYVASKITRDDYLESNQQCELLYEKNGYSFWRVKPN